jgi:hypothetical protein
MALHMRLLADLSDLAARQSGVFSREQALDLGIRPSAIQRAVARGDIIRQLHGIYRFASVLTTRATKLWTALLWAGEGAVLSHRTAGWLFKLDALGLKPPDEIEISIPDTRVVVDTPNVRIYRASVLTHVKDFAKLGRFPCTSIARTIIDLAAVLTEDDLESAFNSAVRLDPENRQAVLDAISRLGTRGREGAATLLRIVRDADPVLTESRLEDRVRQLIIREKIPLPRNQHVIVGRDGKFIARSDFAWPESSVVVCCDGYATHGLRPTFETDRIQWNAMRDVGWDVRVVTWHMLDDDSDGFIDQLRRALARGKPINVGMSPVTGENPSL